MAGSKNEKAIKDRNDDDDDDDGEMKAFTAWHTWRGYLYWQSLNIHFTFSYRPFPKSLKTFIPHQEEEYEFSGNNKKFSTTS